MLVADVILHLRRLRSMRRQLGCDVTAKLALALVLLRLDYCNAVIAAFLPRQSTLVPLQSLARGSKNGTQFQTT